MNINAPFYSDKELFGGDEKELRNLILHSVDVI
jgi:hypothetical protein